MNLRKILIILLVAIVLIIGCLLWSWRLLPLSLVGFIYVRIGWQMIIIRRKMASRIYKDVEASYRSSSVGPIYLYGHAFLFPFSFFTIMFVHEIFKAKKVRGRIKKWFSKIITHEKISWFYKVFVIAFWLPLLIYGVAMATLLFICSIALALLYLIFLALEKIIPFLINFPKIIHDGKRR